MKRLIAVLMIVVVIMLAGCGSQNTKNDPQNKIKNNDIKNKYEKSNGFECTMKLLVEKPIKSSMFELTADYIKNANIKYTVVSPSFMKGLKLDADDTSAIIDYINQSFKIPKDAAKVPISMFFKIPDILQYACNQAAEGLIKESEDSLYVEFMQNDINFKVYFNSKNQTPEKIIVYDKTDIFRGTLSLENFLYK